MDFFIFRRELRPFLLLWISQTFSQLGSAMTALALVVYAYRETGSAIAVTLLTVSAAAPYTIVSLFAGPVVDRLPKKPLMLAADSAAACCTLAVLALHLSGRLEVPYLYAINLGLGFANAFQLPASNVAVTLLVKPEYYTKVSGLQSISTSAQTVAAPISATMLLAFCGLAPVLLVDLGAFLAAFLTLGFAIRIPEKYREKKPVRHLIAECREGWTFLLTCRPLFLLIIFMALVNLLASLSYYSVLPAMILARTGGDEIQLGIVNAVIGVGGIAGGCLAAALPPFRNKVRILFLCCLISFLFGSPLFGIGRSLPVWIVAALAGNLPLPLLIACDSAIFRTKVPLPMQGRLFALRNALQFGTMPIGYLAGGLLADRVCEPFMAGGSPLSQLAAQLTGSGPGSGMALLFLADGVLGSILSFLFCRCRGLEELNTPEQFTTENPSRDLA